MNKNLWIIIFICLLFASCTSTVQNISPSGGDAWVENSYYDIVTGEILAVDDSCVYHVYEEAVYRVPLSKISKIYIRGYSQLSEKYLSVTPLILMETAFIFSSGSSEWDDKVKKYTLISEVLTIGSLLIGNPEVNFKPPLTDKQMEKLKLYCRYPQGLDDLQWNEVLLYYGQTEFKSVAAKYGH